MERLREFRPWMLAAYVDLKKAFDSVQCETLWDLLCLCVIPAGIISLLTSLYSGTESTVNCVGGWEWVCPVFFPVQTGVK